MKKKSARAPKSCFLVIDVGNTTTHFGVCSEDEIPVQFRIPSNKVCLLRQTPGRLRFLSRRFPLSGALVSSVVPLLNPAIEAVCKKAGLKQHWLNYRTPLGIKLLYKKPREIGADRLANVIAVKELYGTPAIVIDIGTTITFDCICCHGAYLGGIITPGPLLTRMALAEHTGLLPFVHINRPPHLIGKSTVHAIQSGMIYGTRALIRGLVAKLNKEMGGRPRVILTGGQLELIRDGWKFPAIIDPLLTLHGLRIIYIKLAGAV